MAKVVGYDTLGHDISEGDDSESGEMGEFGHMVVFLSESKISLRCE